MSKEDERQERDDEVQEETNDMTVDDEVQEETNDMTVDEEAQGEVSGKKDDEQSETKVKKIIYRVPIILKDKHKRYRFGVSVSDMNARFEELKARYVARIAQPEQTRTHRSSSSEESDAAEPVDPAPERTSEGVQAAGCAATQSERIRKRRRGNPKVRPPQKERVRLWAEAAEAAAEAARLQRAAFEARRAKGSSLPTSNKCKGKEAGKGGSSYISSSGAQSSWE